MNEQSERDEVNGENMPVQFDFGTQAVRTVMLNGNIWFVAADVCSALDHSNSRKALSRLDEEEKCIINSHTPGGNQELAIINESGLYNMIMTSRKPQAKDFKRWVTNVVLPSIRKTGHYEARMRKNASGEEDLAQNKGAGAGHEVVFPDYGRYTVTVKPSGILVHRGDFDQMISQDDELTARLLCYQLKSIEALWLKLRLRQAIDLISLPNLEQLEQAVEEGAKLASHYLRCCELRKDQVAAPSSMSSH